MGTGAELKYISPRSRKIVLLLVLSLRFGGCGWTCTEGFFLGRKYSRELSGFKSAPPKSYIFSNISQYSFKPETRCDISCGEICFFDNSNISIFVPSFFSNSRKAKQMKHVLVSFYHKDCVTCAILEASVQALYNNYHILLIPAIARCILSSMLFSAAIS